MEDKKNEGLMGINDNILKIQENKGLSIINYFLAAYPTVSINKAIYSNLLSLGKELTQYYHDYKNITEDSNLYKNYISNEVVLFLFIEFIVGYKKFRNHFENLIINYDKDSEHYNEIFNKIGDLEFKYVPNVNGIELMKMNDLVDDKILMSKASIFSDVLINYLDIYRNDLNKLLLLRENFFKISEDIERKLVKSEKITLHTFSIENFKFAESIEAYILNAAICDNEVKISKLKI